ncbi:malonate decarboxylase holo-ACP synthase [Microtetraspora sp. NBRC 13810]|uniref:malonate decarboxylase holo-ACP synthase n=1 Tax=Microtetraspora sp. NBRC 13810 TaxID=3030990 RepID=UPI0024A22B87|nr:malonate decarboxylase holo-ACP synthase [Microtetraspora sp. NBRC 13810]GLW11303.1 malonate decarboxylase holo-ACP synthase [Microtetraspora sp. NBRC 13810]
MTQTTGTMADTFTGTFTGTTLPHDLLRLTGSAVADAVLPGWASASLAACPWGVVRRAPHPPGLIPVGVRGPARRQRHATLVPAGAVTRRVPPEDLRRERPRLPRLPAALSTALSTALSAAALLLAAELDGDAVWGPIGGVGFELATGRAVTHPGSDLDLLIRAPRRWERALAARLTAAFAALPRRVDCQLETPRGGISLTEWARTGGPVLARTAHGPELVDDPWDVP